jgi:hypothetical protein
MKKLLAAALLGTFALVQAPAFAQDKKAAEPTKAEAAKADPAKAEAKKADPAKAEAKPAEAKKDDAKKPKKGGC